MEFIIMIGLPSSGKSTYARQNYPSYQIISLDNIPQHNRNNNK